MKCDLFILSKVVAYINIWALIIRIIIFIRFQKRKKQISKYLIFYLPRNLKNTLILIVSVI